jgi:DNA-binding NarL/FixJ family response regulator
MRTVSLKNKRGSRKPKAFFCNHADDMTIIAKERREAIDIVNREIPDIIIMDIHTPEIDWTEVVSVIKKKYPDIKIMMFSTYNDTTVHKNNNKNEIQNTDAREMLPLLKDLTKREKEIFTLLAGGYDNIQIADILFLSLQTVKNHVSVIYSKLGVKDRFEIIRLANRV